MALAIRELMIGAVPGGTLDEVTSTGCTISCCKPHDTHSVGPDLERPDADLAELQAELRARLGHHDPA